MIEGCLYITRKIQEKNDDDCLGYISLKKELKKQFYKEK